MTRGIATFLLVSMVAVTLIAFDLWLGLPRTGPALEGELSEVQKQVLKTLIDSTKLLISWSLALIGALGFLVKTKISKEVDIPDYSKIAIVIGLSLAILSLYFGYLVVSGVLNSLSHDLLDIRDPSIALPATLQFLTLIGGVTAASAAIIEPLIGGKS